jgi:hypothetical protein
VLPTVYQCRAEEKWMRARALFGAAVAALVLALSTPAAAKVGIAEVRISGPGLGAGGLVIYPPASEGMWDSGIDWAGGLDDTRAGSARELGLTAADLGPRYVATYRLGAGTERAETVRQELYPYAKGGPVTYAPSGQRIAEGLPWGAAITAGWHQSSSEFFRYLVDKGLPESNPLIVADRESAKTVHAAGSTLWGWISLALAVLAAASVAIPPLRRRALALTGRIARA